MKLTDEEISKALALAIGWTDSSVCHNVSAGCIEIYAGPDDDFMGAFDYRDWSVIGPIAERYDCFPVVSSYLAGQWVTCTDEISVHADTPQKAIALAVIGAKK